MESNAARSDPVVVVTGLPRSGTSMMMRMLEAGGIPVLVDGIRAADPDNPNGYYEYEPVKQLKQDSAWVAGARGKAVKLVYLLLYDLPPSIPYDVIFMQRPLEEVVASQDDMLRRNGGDVLQDESRRLIGLFEKQLQRIETWLRTQPNFRTLSVHYGRTVADPAAACAEIESFLRLDVDKARMQSVVTPELYRHRRERPLAVGADRARDVGRH